MPDVTPGELRAPMPPIFKERRETRERKSKEEEAKVAEAGEMVGFEIEDHCGEYIGKATNNADRPSSLGDSMLVPYPLDYRNIAHHHR